MTEETMAAGFASSFADHACEHGANRDALLSASGLTEDTLSDQDNRIPLLVYHALIGAVMQKTGDTNTLVAEPKGLFLRCHTL